MSALELLSERQREILALVAEGRTNREIAVRLSLADGTVRIHLYNIFQKLRVRRRTEAAIKYLTMSDGGRAFPNNSPERPARRVFRRPE